MRERERERGERERERASPLQFKDLLCLKEIVQPKMKKHLLILRAIQDVEFGSSLEQILGNLALHQNAVRMKSSNITIIHTTPVHQLMSCEVKSF